MIWSSRQLAMMRMSKNKPYEHADVEASKMREEIGLRWFLGYGDEQLAPKELGTIVDDCLVENIRDLLIDFEQGEVGLERFKCAVRLIEEGVKDDPDLKAYATAPQKDKNLPLASETFLELAERRAVCRGKPPDPSKEAPRLAGALLGIVWNADWDAYDWDLRTYSRFCATLWLHDRNPYELLIYIFQAHWNPAAWDTLMLICEYEVQRGMGEIIQLPDNLLRWHVAASFGYPERPGVAPKPPGPPTTHGKKHRDNEIRHAVDLLRQVGVRKMAAYDAVARAVHLEAGSVRNICGKPYWTLRDIRLDIEGRFMPPKQALMSGPVTGSDSTSSS